MIAIPAALAVALSLLLGSPVVGALSAVQIAALAGVALKGAPQAIAAIKQIDRIIHSPAFRAWAARNGAAAIRLQPGAASESGI